MGLKRTRIIPRLDVKGDNLVKGINLEGLRVLGKPEQFAKYYYEAGADELLFVDVVASLYGRSAILEVLEKTAREVFIPMTVAGGVRTLDDISALLRAGADKVAINSAAVARPDFLGEAVDKFGSSTIVLSLEAGKAGDGSYDVLIEYGRQTTGMKLHKWLDFAASEGIGEVLVTSIEQDGTALGLDGELIRLCRERLDVPLIASGGVGSMEHVMHGLESGADAVAVASALHYSIFQELNATPELFVKEGNTRFLFANSKNRRVPGFTLNQLREFLGQRGVLMHGQLTQ